MEDVVLHGTPLPKGRGRLFDERDIVYGNYEIIGGMIYECDPVLGADLEVKMSASMNMEEAKKIAEEMSFKDAVYNALRGKCIPYRKATTYKLKELLEIAEKIDKNIV